MRTFGGPTWDELDSQILKLLRRNGRMPLAEIALQLGVAMSTVSNRIKRLTEAGVVQGYRLVVDPRFAIAGVEALVTLNTPRHEDLQRVLAELAEAGVQVAEVYRTLGSAEYVCRVVAPSADHLDRAMAIARRAEKDRVDAVVLSELLPTVAAPAIAPHPASDVHAATADGTLLRGPGENGGSPAIAPAPDSLPQRLIPGSRIYFISLTELDPEQVEPARLVQQLAQAGFTTVVVDAINPWGAYYPTRLAPLAPHCHGQDLIGAFGAAAGQHGLQVLAAIECRAVPPFLAAEHPRWLQRHANAEACCAYGPFYRGCYRTGWQEWLRSVAKQLLEAYPVAGLVLLNPEYDPDSCHCETCQRGFRDRRGVQLPAPDGPVDYPTYARWLDWKVESVVGLVAGFTRLVHQSSDQRQLWVMSDQALAERSQAFGLDLSALAAVADAVICAGEPQQRSSAPLLDSLNRWDRGAALTPPGAFATSLSASYAPWTRYPVPTTSLQQAMAALAAAGQGVTCLDLGPLRTTLPRAVDATLPRAVDAALPSALDATLPSALDATLPSALDATLPSALDASLASAQDATLPPVLPATSPVTGRLEQLSDSSEAAFDDLSCYAALLYSERDWCSEHGQQATPTHAACFHGLYAALSRANIPFRVISLEQAVRSRRQQALLSVYRTLILPGLNDLPLTFAAWLADFVQSGGGLLVTYPGVLADRQSPAAPVLQEVLGLARVSRPSQPAEAAYAKRQAGAGYPGPELLPAYPRWLTCEPDRAATWAELLSQESAWGGVAQTGSPALLAHTKGQGRTLCCTFPLGVLYSQFADPNLEQFLRSALGWTARQPTPVQIDAERPVLCRIIRPNLPIPAQATAEANAHHAHHGHHTRHAPNAHNASIAIYLVDGDFAWGPRPWREVPPLPRGSVTIRLPRPPQAAAWSPTIRAGDGSESPPTPSAVPGEWQRVGTDRYRFPLPSCTGAAILTVQLSP